MGFSALPRTVLHMNTDAKKATGTAVRSLRAEAGLTQVQVAERLGKPQSYVSKIESGERALQAHELIPLAGALGLPTHDVLDAIAAALERAR